MTTMITEIYDALLAAGAPDDKARRAAEAVSTFQLASLEPRLVTIESELRFHRWLFGAMLAIQLGGFGWIIALLKSGAL